MKYFVDLKICPIFAPAKRKNSKTFWSIRLSVRTPGFHPGKRGSTPLWTTTNKQN